MFRITQQSTLIFLIYFIFFADVDLTLDFTMTVEERPFLQKLSTDFTFTHLVVPGIAFIILAAANLTLFNSKWIQNEFKIHRI